MELEILQPAAREKKVFFKDHRGVSFPAVKTGGYTSEDIREILKVYSFLLPTNQPVTFGEMADMIQRTYDTSGRTAAAAAHQFNINMLRYIANN